MKQRFYQKGGSVVLLVIGLGILVVAVLIASNLVQKSQENRSHAASGENTGCYISNVVNTGKPGLTMNLGESACYQGYFFVCRLAGHQDGYTSQAYGTFCYKNILRKCTKDNKLMPVGNCKYGCDDGQTKCNSICKKGKSGVIFDRPVSRSACGTGWSGAKAGLYICYADGSWNKQMTCPNGCTDGEITSSCK